MRGPTVDPTFTHQRAKRAGAARHDPRTYARSIVAKWPTLDDQVRAELRAILAPVVGSEAGR